jgi:hypothetical protein
VLGIATPTLAQLIGTSNDLLLIRFHFLPMQVDEWISPQDWSEIFPQVAMAVYTVQYLMLFAPVVILVALARRDRAASPNAASAGVGRKQK